MIFLHQSTSDIGVDISLINAIFFINYWYFHSNIDLEITLLKKIYNRQEVKFWMIINDVMLVVSPTKQKL